MNFGDHHQEFFRVRSIWYFEKFNLTSLDLSSKISQFDWKWDVWKLFLGLAHEFSTIEHRKKIFLFGWISSKFNAPLNLEHSILTDIKINRNGFKGSGQDISALEGSDSWSWTFWWIFHVNSGILGSVDISWLSHVDPLFTRFGFLL